MTDKIDFVITWVDGNDPDWRKVRDHYAALEHKDVDNSIVRYRDWETLKYWFRGVEKFAPWVNNIFFVTYGHLPSWLDTSHPKLKVVKHEDFIPAKYLPTFNSNVIEFYLHKIKGLSDRFVYFNDDMLILDTIKPTRFFRNGLPCDLSGIKSTNHRGIFGSSIYLAITLINDHFNKKKVLTRYFSKWFNFRYPSYSIGNLLFYFIGGKNFSGFYVHHMAQGYLKEIYEEVWNNCEEDLVRISKNRFRNYGDIAHWLIRYWQLTSGHFVPYNTDKDSKYFTINDTDIEEITDYILHQRARLICLNDTEVTTHYEETKEKILAVLHEILPEKSRFELI